MCKVENNIISVTLIYFLFIITNIKLLQRQNYFVMITLYYNWSILWIKQMNFWCCDSLILSANFKYKSNIKNFFKGHVNCISSFLSSAFSHFYSPKMLHSKLCCDYIFGLHNFLMFLMISHRLICSVRNKFSYLLNRPYLLFENL